MGKKTTTKKISKISICIPNYNRAENLDELLRDCTRQTVLPFEILVQDDSFSKEEKKKIDAVMRRYRGVEFRRNKHNVGLAVNVNRALMRAKGEFLVIANNDDRLSPFFIQSLQNAVDQYPDIDVFTTNACAMRDDGEIIGEYRIDTHNRLLQPKQDIAILWRKFMINLISVSGATMYRRSYIQKNPFAEEYGNEADLHNALRLLSTKNVMYIDVPVYFVRMNEQNTSVEIRAKDRKRNAYIARCLHIYREYLPQFSHISHYLETPKCIYFLQLFTKYRYPLPKIRKILLINNHTETVLLFWRGALYCWVILLATLQFKMHRSIIRKYAPLA